MRLRPIPALAALSVLVAAACSGGGGGGDDPVTISGAVISTSLGPVEAARVVIPGAGEATTDAAGRFSIAGVRAPYALVAVKNDGAQDHVAIYEGLRRTDPAIAIGARGTERVSPAVSGTLSGFEDVADSQGVVKCTSPELNGVTCSVDAAGAFSCPGFGDLRWQGPASTALTCSALRYHPGTLGALPTAYVGFWTGTATLQDGASPDPLTLSTAAVGARTVTIHPQAAEGTSASRLQAGLRLGPTAAHQLPFVMSPGAELSYVAPVVSGATFQLLLVSETATHDEVFSALDVPEGVSSVTVSTPTALALEAPAANAELAAAPQFAWTARPGAVHVLRLTPGVGGAPAIRVVTTAPSADLARLADAGITLPAGALYAWSVEAHAPLGSADAYATVGAVRDAQWLFSGYAPFRAGGTVWRTSSRLLTTAP